MTTDTQQSNRNEKNVMCNKNIFLSREKECEGSSNLLALSCIKQLQFSIAWQIITSEIKYEKKHTFKLLQHFSENFRDNNSTSVEKGERKKPFDHTRVQKKPYTV